MRCVPRLAAVLALREIAGLGFDPVLMPDTGLTRDHGARVTRGYGVLAPPLPAVPGAHRSTTSAAHLVEPVASDRWGSVTGAHVIGRRPFGTSRAWYHVAAGGRWNADQVRSAGADALARGSGGGEPRRDSGS